MGYKRKVKKQGMRVRVVYEETVSEVDGRRGKIRKEIDERVGDRDKLIGDLFKLNFLTISALKAVYNVIDTSDIPAEVRALLDTSFEKYENTKTVMDLYLEKGDTSFIDRMLDRQNEITSILENN